MEYTEEELEEYIRDASERGKPDLVKFYQWHLDRIRAEKAT
jgi:hypothetical protein